MKIMHMLTATAALAGLLAAGTAEAKPAATAATPAPAADG